MDTKEQLEQDLCHTLGSLPIPVDIVPYLTCFGKNYWEWWVKSKGAHGVEASFSEAVGEALTALLTVSLKMK